MGPISGTVPIRAFIPLGWSKWYYIGTSLAEHNVYDWVIAILYRIKMDTDLQAYKLPMSLGKNSIKAHLSEDPYVQDLYVHIELLFQVYQEYESPNVLQT
jgi:hypothetical protein